MNELTTVKPAASNVEAYRASTDAAELCKAIVLASSSTIQGRNYVSVEGWQAVARAHGCAAGASHVERVEGGVRAVGEVRDILTGQLVAQAEGFVGEDEAVWFGGTVTDKWGKTKTHPKRPDYAIRAMAQTRAMSRACRSAFAHVVVMMNAGLQTTPAEEITYDVQTGEIIDTTTREKVPGIHKIKERLSQLRKAGDAETDLEAFNALVKAHKDDLKTIRDANHEWWTGDGEDFEGYAAWKDRRKAELSHTDSASFQLLTSLVQEAKSYEDLRSILDEHEETISKLDGDESRRFDLSYNNRESDFAAMPTPLTEGAFGG